MLKKELALTGVSAITMSYVPNLFGHPIGILILLLLGIFSLPQDPIFFICWFGVVITAAVISIFKIIGLLNTNFFLTQAIGNLGFVSSSFFAVLLLGEKMSFVMVVAYVLAFLGILIFSWRRFSYKNLVFDRGLLFTIFAVILYGLSFVLYKLSTFYVSDYYTFLTGRFIGDLFFWGVVWLFVCFRTKKKPFFEFMTLARDNRGKRLIFLTAIISLGSSWTIYELPVTTIALLGTVSFPVSYFIGWVRYGEKLNIRILLGTIFIISSIVLLIFD